MDRSDLLERARIDPKFYLENFCKIKTKDEGLQPFILNEAQKDLLNCIRQEDRIIILKARQLGFSTIVAGSYYHSTIFTPGINTVIIAHTAKVAGELFDKMKTFYRTTPDSLKPTIEYNSKNEMSFPKIESKIMVLPATDEAGRAYTIHRLHCSELAFWDNAEERMSALEDAVPIHGKIIVESTPSGASGKYYRMWKSKDNGYAKKEYGWWWGYTPEEIEIIEKRKNDPRKFAQEYSLMFLASGRNFFDVDAIEKQRLNVLKEGDHVVLDAQGNKHEVTKRPDGLRVYRPVANKDETFVIGADTAEGLRGGDFSVAVIISRTTGEEVAFYRGCVTPDKFAMLLNQWGREFNNALMVEEMSGSSGLTTLTVLKQLLYPNLYLRPSRYDAYSMSMSDRMGWRTTKVTRGLLLNDLNAIMRDGDIIIHSEEILDEMVSFVFDRNNTPNPSEGSHDDCIFGTGLAVQGFKVLVQDPLKDLGQLDYTQILPQSFAY